MKRAFLSTLSGVAGSVFLLHLYSRIDSPWCWIGWAMLVPWLASLDQTRTLRETLANALLMNLVFVLGLFGWFADTIQIYTGASLGIALLTLVLVAPILEPQFFVFAVVRYLARNTTGARFGYVTLTAASAYVAAEWAFPKLFTVTLGHCLYGSKLMRQAADISGTAGLTFLLVIVNECVLAVVRAVADRDSFPLRLRRAWLPASLAVLIPVVLLGYGYLRCRQIEQEAASAPKLKVAAIQANISNYEQIAKQIGTFEGVRFILDAHYRLSSEAIKRSNPDLIVWPETVYPTTFGSPRSAEGGEFDREIGHFVGASGHPFIIGTYDAESGQQFNAAMFIGTDANGLITYEMYRKALLFPFTERVPAWLDFSKVREWFPWLGTWAAGLPPEAVAVDFADGRRVRVAPLICYDALEPNLALSAARKGANMIVTLSNDSWFAAGIAPRFHLTMAAFRSIETHLPQVRATNTGISAAITATGDITDSLATGESGVLVSEVALTGNAGTLMLRWGNWLPPLALLCSILLLTAPRLVRPRPSSRPASPRRKKK